MPVYRTPDRVRLNYSEAGDGRPTLILIQGWASRLDHWQPIVTPLARHHRVLRLDLRGHGRSEASADGYSMRQFADGTAALARSRRIRESVIGGHSMGSTVALELTRLHPRLVAGVVIVDGALDQYTIARHVDRSDLLRHCRSHPKSRRSSSCTPSSSPIPATPPSPNASLPTPRRHRSTPHSLRGESRSPRTSRRSRSRSGGRCSTSAVATGYTPRPRCTRCCHTLPTLRPPSPATSSSLRPQTNSPR
jgi:pimeloyl-ACP methyl ester carboxylesterase